MNVLIFGGAGYVGYQLTKLFHEHGDTVTVFDSFSNGDQTARDKMKDLTGVAVYEGDIADTKAVHQAVMAASPDIVYNLAAIHYIPYCIENPDKVFATNYQGLQNIITEVGARSDTRLIFASSASVYGSPNERCTIDTPVTPNDIYGASKLAGEHLITYQLHNYVLMRLFNVYGELDPHPHLIPKVARAAVRNEVLELGTACAHRDFVYVKDVAKAFFVAKDAPAGEIYIIATGETHTVKETVDRIYALAESTGEVRYETAANLRAKDASYLCGDPSKLCELGWRPRAGFDDVLMSAVAAARLAEL